MCHDQMIYDRKDTFNKCTASCANIYHDAKTFEADGMVSNITD